MKQFIIILIALSAIYTASCDKDGYCPGAKKGWFTDNLSCGAIKLRNGDFLEPTNLGDFDVIFEDGKEVWVKYKEIEGVISYCGKGTRVEIICITD